MYRPCVPTAGDKKQKGPFTVHCQHVRNLLSNGDNRLPRRALMDDLKAEVIKWKEKGDSIIIMGDFNEDVRNDYCTQWRDELGMRDILMDRVGKDNMPSTHIRGSEPIDSVWATANVEVKRIVVMPQDEGIGDHRPLMFDIIAESVFGYDIPPTPAMKARRLKNNDPRIAKKYIQALVSFYKKHNFFKRVHDLSQIPMEYPLQPLVQKLYEKLDTIRVKAMKHAEAKCRKFKCGQIPWSPAIDKAHNYIELWN